MNRVTCSYILSRLIYETENLYYLTNHGNYNTILKEKNIYYLLNSLKSVDFLYVSNYKRSQKLI